MSWFTSYLIRHSHHASRRGSHFSTTMKVVALLVASIAVAFAQVTLPCLRSLTILQTIDFEYIVEFTASSTDADIATHMARVADSGSKVLHNYNFGSFRGYAVRVPHGASLADSRISFLMAPEVSHFEANQIYKASAPAGPRNSTKATANCHVQEDATWGLVRVAQEELYIDG